MIDDDLVVLERIGNSELCIESPDYAGPAQTVPYDSREKKTDDVHLSAVEFPKEPACQGLTLEHLALKTKKCKALEDGICRVVADLQHRKATAVAHRLDWPVDSSKFIGCIDNSKTKEVRVLLRQRDDRSSTSGGLHEHVGFVSVQCSGHSKDDGPCESCQQEERFLRVKCLTSAGWNVDVEPGNRQGSKLSVQESPTKLRTMLRDLVVN
jgi:hypothetical protein